jgi:hypothetical protein
VERNFTTFDNNRKVRRTKEQRPAKRKVDRLFKHMAPNNANPAAAIRERDLIFEPRSPMPPGMRRRRRSLSLTHELEYEVDILIVLCLDDIIQTNNVRMITELL